MADHVGYAATAATPTLVGRERELATLRAALAAALAGHGSLVLIGGEAGIGKTTLAEWLCGEAADRGALVLVGRCYDLSETPPYGPWREALARAPRGDDAPDPPDLTTGAGAASQAALFATVRDSLAALAATRPLVLLLDDLHWADMASLDLLRFLGRQLADLPLLLLATYRSDELTRRHPLYALLPALEREARATRLELRPLDVAGLGALVAARHALPDGDAARLVAWLHARAEGNAFFTAQLLRTLEDEAILAPVGDRWALGDLGRVGLPTALRQVLDTRLGRLGADHHRLLTLAAVLGQVVPLALWAAVAGTDEDALLDAVDAAEEAHLVAAAPDGAAVRFAHALIREALYVGLLSTRRRGVHRRAAEALAAAPNPDPGAVAHHLQRAGDPRAAAWLERAGERAQRAYAWVTAADHYEAALALLEAADGDAAARGWLLLRLGLLRRHADRAQATAFLAATAEQAARAADPLLAAYADFNAGLFRCYVGDLHPGVADMAGAVAALDALPPPDAATRARLRAWGLADDPDHHRGTLALWLANVGRLAEARALGARVAAGVATAPVLGWLDGAFAPDALRALGLVHAALGGPAEAQTVLERNLGAYQAAGDPLQVGITAGMLVRVLLAYRADDPAARRQQGAVAERSFARATAAGNPFPGLAWLAPLLLVEGRWDALRALAAGWEPMAPHAATAVRALAPFAAACADHDLARALLSTLPQGAATPPGGALYDEGLALLRLGAAQATEAGDLPAARAWLEAHDRWLAWAGATVDRAEGALGWSAYHRAAGDMAHAHRHAEGALAHATDPRQPLARLAAHRALGELASAAGAHGAAADHLAAALALADACAAPYERALALLALAELRAADGRGAEASPLLTEARALLAALGARPALARADVLVARLAAPWPVPHPAAPFGLTVREAEILTLVAAGLPNVAIADRLSLSRRTVEQHLRSVYDKLGVENRAGATRLAVEHGLAGGAP